jgi:hypothetical protein
MAEFRIEGVPAENNKSLCGGGHLGARAAQRLVFQSRTLLAHD